MAHLLTFQLILKILLDLLGCVQLVYLGLEDAKEGSFSSSKPRCLSLRATFLHKLLVNFIPDAINHILLLEHLLIGINMLNHFSND